MPGGRGKITPKDGEKTRFSAVNQPETQGRKPGIRLWKNVFAEMLDNDGTVTFTDIVEVDDAGRPTGNVFKRGRVKMPTQEALAMSVLKKALAKGDIQAFNAVADRMEGKPTQPVEGGENPIKFVVANATKDKDVDSDPIE